MAKTKEQIMAMSSEEYDKFMVSSFPNQFRERNLSMQQTCMCWGFDINKGWYYILYELCSNLNIIEKEFGICVVWTQIKEKFGSGRFYHSFDLSPSKKIKMNIFSLLSKIGINCFLNKANGINNVIYEAIFAMIDKAEAETNNTCEISGEKYYHPKPCVHGWIYGMSYDSFVKQFPERKEELDRQKRRGDLIENIKSALYYLNDEQLDKHLIEINNASKSAKENYPNI